MEPFIVRQIITDKYQLGVGYEIILANPKGAENKSELYESAAADAVSRLSDSSLSEGKTAFISFTHDMLAAGIPDRFDKNKLVIQADDALISDRAAHRLIAKYRRSGYKIAVIGFKFDSGHFGIIDSIDYIKIDFRDFNSPEMENVLRAARNFNKKIIAYNIECAEAYTKAKLCGAAYYQGTYIYGKIPAAVRKKGIMREGACEFFSEIFSGRSDIDGITQAITRYPKIEQAVTDLANSRRFASDMKVESAQKAIARLGMENLEKYAFLIGFKIRDGSMPAELIKFSLLRGILFSELSEAAEDIPLTPAEAFTAGNMSMIGRLFHKPLNEVLPQYISNWEICAALMSDGTRAGTLFKLICEYERANMKRAAEYAAELGIPEPLLPKKYCECALTADALWRRLITPAKFRE